MTRAVGFILTLGSRDAGTFYRICMTGKNATPSALGANFAGFKSFHHTK